MADYSPVNPCGTQPFTCKVGASAVTGGKIVMVGADGTVIHATAAAKAAAIGVAAHDAAAGAQLSVWPLHGPVHRVSCPSGATFAHAITSGDAGIAVDVASVGTDAALGSLCGIVLKTVAADAAALVTFIGRG